MKQHRKAGKSKNDQEKTRKAIKPEYLFQRNFVVRMFAYGFLLEFPVCLIPWPEVDSIESDSDEKCRKKILRVARTFVIPQNHRFKPESQKRLQKIMYVLRSVRFLYGRNLILVNLILVDFFGFLVITRHHGSYERCH